MSIIRKKFVKIFSVLLCIAFINFVIIIYFPFLHNLDADINVWNFKYFVILKGEHHHEANPKLPGFEYHEIKLIDIENCPICNVLDNARLFISSQSVNFCYNFNFLLESLPKSLNIPSNIYDLPLLRAPPLA